MAAKRNSLAFELYPTFVILTTNMDIISETIFFPVGFKTFHIFRQLLVKSWESMESYGTINKLLNEVLLVRMH